MSFVFICTSWPRKAVLKNTGAEKCPRCSFLLRQQRLAPYLVSLVYSDALGSFRVFGHGSKVDIQRLPLPQVIDLLAFRPSTTVVSQPHVEVEYDACQDEPHLGVSEARYPKYWGLALSIPADRQ